MAKRYHLGADASAEDLFSVARDVIEEERFERLPAILKQIREEYPKAKIPDDIYKHDPDRKPRILTTYEIVTYGDEGEYPEIENGWIDEEGYEVGEDGLDEIVDNAVKFLKREYVTESSSYSYWQPHTWYIGPDDEDYSTGAREQKSYHLKDFTETEEKEIWNRVTGKIGRLP